MVHQWGFFGSISAIRKIWSLTANSRSLQAAALKRCGIPQSSLVKVYLSLIRPVLEYAVTVWQNLTQALACSLENVQKRAFAYISYV